jgi:hypothetical protein
MCFEQKSKGAGKQKFDLRIHLVKKSQASIILQVEIL